MNISTIYPNRREYEILDEETITGSKYKYYITSKLLEGVIQDTILNGMFYS